MSYSADSYRFFKAHGICTRCNKERAIEGHTMCADCLANEAVRESKHTPMSEAAKARRKAKYEYRKTNGLCLDCGKPRHKDSGSYCYEHMLYHRRKKREAKQGGADINGLPPVAGNQVSKDISYAKNIINLR